MIKIEEDMVKAIKNKKNFHRGSTIVIYDDIENKAEVLLYGHHIATCRDNFIEVNEKTLHRWNTVTTRSRLRALGVYVSSKKFTPHIFGVNIEVQIPSDAFELYIDGSVTKLGNIEDLEALVKVVCAARAGVLVTKVGSRYFLKT